MVEPFRAEAINDLNFGLLSVASLLKKIRDGISIEELYREAERKFDTLIKLASDTYTDKTVIDRFGYSLDELKEMSMLIFNRLITDKSSNPYITLCVSEGASLEEIKRRRNKLLYIFHPDRNSEKLTNGNNTMRINEAYEIISNKYYKADKPFEFIKTRVPRYNSYRKKMMLMLFILFIIFIITFLILMTSNKFF
jgi:hypothetical protein